MSINNRNEVTCKVVPLTTTNKTLLAGGFDSFMLWHLHANNVTTNPVTVDIYIGDELATALNGLLISLVLPPNGSESIPVSLSQISFPLARRCTLRRQSPTKPTWSSIQRCANDYRWANQRF